MKLDFNEKKSNKKVIFTFTNQNKNAVNMYTMWYGVQKRSSCKLNGSNFTYLIFVVPFCCITNGW